MRLSDENVSLAGFMWPSSICHTWARLRRRSPARLRSVRRPTCHRRRGRENQPCNPSGRRIRNPHALTWNMGTTGSTESRADRHITSGSARSVGVQRWWSGGCTARLRVACGAAGAYMPWMQSVFIKLGPAVIRRLRANPGLVAQQPWNAQSQAACRHRTVPPIASQWGTLACTACTSGRKVNQSTAPGLRRG